MKRILRALGALVFLGAGSGAACSLLVASEFNGYSLANDSGVCTLPPDAATLCASCITQNCASQVTAHCGDQLFTNLASCAADPSPDSVYGGCGNFVGDAAGFTEDNNFAMKQCVAINCSGPQACTQCVDVDAGRSLCGQCIMNNCANLLSGLTGCCGDNTLQDWISDCTYDLKGDTCANLESAIRNNYPNPDGGGALPPGSIQPDAGDCVSDFGICVYNNCVGGGRGCN
jgi:hypothetical protein